ncbi:MAG: glycosyltransferase family 4 protein [Chloroflexota bacterium]|nr:glycosyltransferase family 4 protein [Chloroflexota bacterium]
MVNRDSRRPLRIAIAAPFAIHPKGTTLWRVLPLARALAEAGHAVRVVIPPYDWPCHGGTRWWMDGVDVFNVPVPGRLDPSGIQQVTRQITRSVMQWQPDLVHLFKPKGFGGITAALLAVRTSVPWVMDADDWEAGWNQRMSYPAIWRRFFAWQERWGLRSAGAVTAASHWLVGFARGLRGGSDGVLYLPNRVSPQIASNSHSHNAMARQHAPAMTAGGRPPRVLLFTRFVEHTPDLVWRVWRRVLAEQPAAELLVGGAGSSGEQQQLLALARKHGAESSIRLLGWVPASSLPGLFGAVDAGLLPVIDQPLNRAKSPMRLLDLLAAGVPVATNGVGEYGRFVNESDGGLVVAPADWQGLANGVLRLLGEVDLRRRLRSQGIQWSQRNGWPKAVPELEELYWQLC